MWPLRLAATRAGRNSRGFGRVHAAMTEYLASVAPAPAPAALYSKAVCRRSWTDGANLPTPLQQLPNGGLESNGAATLSGERRRRTSRELVGLESGLSATPREATVLRVDTRPDTPSGHWSSPTSRRFFAERGQD